MSTDNNTSHNKMRNMLKCGRHQLQCHGRTEYKQLTEIVALFEDAITFSSHPNFLRIFSFFAVHKTNEEHEFLRAQR